MRDDYIDGMPVPAGNDDVKAEEAAVPSAPADQATGPSDDGPGGGDGAAAAAPEAAAVGVGQDQDQEMAAAEGNGHPRGATDPVATAAASVVDAMEVQ